MTIIFDFDGTLADSYGVMLALFNDEAANYGLRTLSAEDWEKIRRMRFSEILKFVGIKPHQVPKFIALGKQVLKGHNDKIILFDDIVDMIKRLQAGGHDLYVLSSNGEDIIQAVLDRYEIGFMTVMKSSKLFGKAAPLKRLARSQQVPNDQVWMVGDETRDILAAHKADIQSLAVTWGFHPREMLEPAQPVAFADTPKELADFFDGQR